MNELIRGAEVISLFSRITTNTRMNLPVRSSEMGMLIYLLKSNSDGTPIKIAEFFRVSKPMVTSMINSLTKKGYLIKIPSTTDKRSFALKPTEIAVQLVEQTYAEYYKNMKILVNGMGEENYNTMLNLLEMANGFLIK